MKIKTKKTKIIVIVAVAIVIVLSVVAFSATIGNAGVVAKVTTLEKSDLINSVSVKGTVESINHKNVYTALGYIIKDVYVEVGDTVTEGQILTELDTENLEFDIAKQKADLDASQKSTLNQLQSDQRIYNEAVSNLNNGTNTKVLSGENSVKTSKINLESAKKKYDDKLKERNDGTNAQIVSAKSALQSASMDLETKKLEYENNKILYEAGAITKSVCDQSENAYILAKSKYSDSETSLKNAETSVDSELEQLKLTLKTNQVNYENSVASQTASIASANQEVEQYKTSVTKSNITIGNDSAVISIQKLEKQLEDSKIKAPMAGKVTAVYAKQGATGNGLLFVIENTDALKIVTKIKEYDSGKIKPGMLTIIKSDATGNDTYEGEISKIAPTSIKDTSGEANSTTDVEFEAEVAVKSQKTNLKVGTNTRLSIVLEKKENVYSVPYDQIVTNKNGESIVYIVNKENNGKYKVGEVVVQTGMETDFYIEISGEGLSDGLKIISDTSKITVGQEVTID